MQDGGPIPLMWRVLLRMDALNFESMRTSREIVESSKRAKLAESRRSIRRSSDINTLYDFRRDPNHPASALCFVHVAKSKI